MATISAHPAFLAPTEKISSFLPCGKIILKVKRLSINCRKEPTPIHNTTVAELQKSTLSLHGVSDV